MATQQTKDKKALERYLAKLDLIRKSGVLSATETKEDQAARIERAKKDFAYCVSYYFPHYADAATPDFHIEAARHIKRKPIGKTFLQWGRGLAKSVVADILVPFWLHIQGEPMYMVVVGSSAKKAEQLLSDIHAEFEGNPRIVHDFGEQKINGSWEDGYFVTKSGFVGQSLGMGMNVRGLRERGLRPTYIVVDDIETRDIAKNPKRQDEIAKWIERDLIPTMDGDKRRFVYAHNKYAPRMIQTVLQAKHPKWKVLEVAAYNPVTFEPRWKSKYSKTYYRELIEGDDGVGTLAGKAEYNNEPHIEGKIFLDEHIQWTDLPRIDHFQLIVGHWDVAYSGSPTGDFNAITVCGVKGKDYFYIDGYCKQSKMKAAVDWMCNFQKELPGSAEVHWQFEAQFWNDEVERIIQECEQAHGIDLNIVRTERPKSNKYDRILSMHPVFQGGKFYFNNKKRSHNDTQEGLAQLKGIEPGYKTHDDFPDALEGTQKRLSQEIRVGNYADPVTVPRTHSKRY